MEIKKLIKMANQIGDFFAGNPDEVTAKKEIAAHLEKFWNSVMIDAIVVHVKQEKETTLQPLVVSAIKEYLVT